MARTRRTLRSPSEVVETECDDQGRAIRLFVREGGSERTLQITEYPEDGPWGVVIRTEETVSYCPRDSRKQGRYERRLPSGAILVDDLRQGYIMRSEYFRDWDAVLLKPVGRPMGDRAIMKRQSDGLPWCIVTTQEEYGPGDVLVAKHRRLVETYVGNERRLVIELSST